MASKLKNIHKGNGKYVVKFLNEVVGGKIEIGKTALHRKPARDFHPASLLIFTWCGRYNLFKLFVEIR